MVSRAIASHKKKQKKPNPTLNNKTEIVSCGMAPSTKVYQSHYNKKQMDSCAVAISSKQYRHHSETRTWNRGSLSFLPTKIIYSY